MSDTVDRPGAAAEAAPSLKSAGGATTRTLMSLGSEGRPSRGPALAPVSAFRAEKGAAGQSAFVADCAEGAAAVWSRDLSGMSGNERSPRGEPTPFRGAEPGAADAAAMSGPVGPIPPRKACPSARSPPGSEVKGEAPSGFADEEGSTLPVRRANTPMPASATRGESAAGELSLATAIIGGGVRKTKLPKPISPADASGAAACSSPASDLPTGSGAATLSDPAVSGFVGRSSVEPSALSGSVRGLGGCTDGRPDAVRESTRRNAAPCGSWMVACDCALGDR